MAPSSPPTEIILRVKVPPGHIDGAGDDFTLGAIYTHLTIGAVRQRISQLLPSNPAPERQRLLHGGRALIDNEQTIADALNTKRDPSQTEYVIHLLVKGEQANVAPAVHRRVASTPGSANTSDRAAAPTGGLGGGSGSPRHDGYPRLQVVPPHQTQQFAQFQQRQAEMHYRIMEQQRNGGPPPGSAPLQMPQMPVLEPMGGPMPRPVHVHHGQPAPSRQLTQPRTTDRLNAASPLNAQQPVSQPPQANGAPTTNATDQAIPAGDTQQHGAPNRPVSGQGFHVQGVGPDGNRFEIHQQTLNFPLNGLPGQHQFPLGFQLPQMPGMGLPFPMPGMAQHQHQHHHHPQQQAGHSANPPSALERARQNVTEMRQMVDEMRNANASEEERARIARMEEHINAVTEYIDPFRLGHSNQGARSALPLPPRAPQNTNAPMPTLPFGVMPFQAPQARVMPTPTRAGATQQNSTASDITCYLLSSPTGPQALLFSPQHGQYNGSLPQPPQATSVRSRFIPRFAQQPVHHPTPTPTQSLPADPPNQDQAAPAPALAVAQVQNPQPPAAAAPAAQDPLQPLLAHFWLLFRVMIFAYFLLGANMGWRRPVALVLIGLGFWMIRAGLFGENGVARRWWEGIVHIPGRENGAVAPGQEGQGGEGVQGGVQTPEQLAQRLIAERQARLNQAPLHRIMRWAREEIRPVERAAALFLASLWPGIGEAHVRAREEEERRQNEAEVERRRVEEEERVRLAEESEKGEKGEKGEGAGAHDEAGGSDVAAEGSSEKHGADEHTVDA